MTSKTLLTSLLLFVTIFYHFAYGKEPGGNSIVAMPVYEQWQNGNTTLSQLTIPFQSYLNLGRHGGLVVRSNQTNTNGDSLNNLQFFSDTQIGLSYNLSSLSTVLHLDANLPSGKTELDTTDFLSAIEFSRPFYDFSMPSTGQGLNVAAGFTWASTFFDDNIVMGFGATYSVRGEYKPLQNMLQAFNPGDELSFTGGLDIVLGPTNALTMDVIYARNQADKVAERTVFQAGDKWVFNLRYQQSFDFNMLEMLARYRTRGRNTRIILGLLQQEAVKTSVTEFEFLARYMMRFSQEWRLEVFLEGQSFQSTPTLPPANLGGLGIKPVYHFSNQLSLPFRLKYASGTFTGFEIAAGLAFRF